MDITASDLIPLWSAASGGRLSAEAQKAMNHLAEIGALEAILPAKQDIFRAFDQVSPFSCRVAVIGQDPYPDPGDAMGLAFSSRARKLPASLRNIYKELVGDLAVMPPATGDLSSWVEQGVLLANTSLTLGLDGTSHFDIWAGFTQEWVKTLASSRPIVWFLWGKHAQAWKHEIERHGRGIPHCVIESAHPSPLSARRGFFGSKPFSKANVALRSFGIQEINWGESREAFALD